MAAPNKFEQTMIDALKQGRAASTGGAPSFNPDWIRQLHANAGVTPAGGNVQTIQPTYGARGVFDRGLLDQMYRQAGEGAIPRNLPGANVPPPAPNAAGITQRLPIPELDQATRNGAAIEQRFRIPQLDATRSADDAMRALEQIQRPAVPRVATPYVDAGNRMAAGMSEFGRSQTGAARAANMTGLMSQATGVDPLAAKMAAPIAKAAPLGAKMAIRGALTDAAAGAKAVLPVAGKALGVVGTGLDWMDQATDPNSAGNRIAAETKAQADAYMAAHRPAAALAANLWGAGRQAVNLSPVGQVGRLYDAAAPVLKDFAAGLMGAGATPAPVQAAAPVAAPAAAPAMRPLGIPDAHPSRSPVAAAAANAYARMTGQPDFHSTHPSTHSAEDWARANSHLTIGQLKALVDMMPKPRAAKDIIGAHALNAIQQRYAQDMVDAKSAQASGWWDRFRGHNEEAVAAAQRRAQDNFLRHILGLSAQSAMPTAMTLDQPVNEVP